MRRKSWLGSVIANFLLSGIVVCVVYYSLLFNVMSMSPRFPIDLYNNFSLSPKISIDSNNNSRFLNHGVESDTNNLYQRLVYRTDCKKLIEGDEIEITKVLKFNNKSTHVRIKNEDFLDLAKDCTFFRRWRLYDVFPVSNEEREFPIAYSILMYKDVDQAERLLRAIYRPTNVYCIHVDVSANKTVHEGINVIAQCFNNVFVVSKKVDVVYNGFSRLQADINCMEDLIKDRLKWKYFINLPSQEFPLKTNLEIVKILKIYNGANDIEGITKRGRMMRRRFENRTAPPHGVQMVKGSAYGIFSREMVLFILNDKKARDILQWSKKIVSPDEYYWAILNHNKNLRSPGGYWGDPNKKPWLATYAAWAGRDRCHGRFLRGVCVFGVGDLPELVSRKELFANKFFLDYQPLALDCLEEWLFNKTFSNLPFETFYYLRLPFIHKTYKT